MRQARTIGLLLLFVLFSMGAVSAAQPLRLQINMSETVYQNVTYGEDFWTTNVMDEDVQNCVIEGVLNISNPSNDFVADINLSFINTHNMSSNFTWVSGRNGTQVAGSSPGDTYIIHITELRANDYSLFNYTINCTQVDPPLDIVTTYTNSDTGITSKVLAGHNWTINQSVSNQLAIGSPINNVNITMQAQTVTWNSTTENFTLSYLYPQGDAANVVGNGTDNYHWYWMPNGGTINPSQSYYVAYDVTAPDSVPTSNTYIALKETLEYAVLNELASNITLWNVTAIADVETSLDKQIIRPANEDNNTNVTWEVSATLSVPFNMSFNLTKVLFWVTQNLDPTNYSMFGPGGSPLVYNETPHIEVNQTSSWSPASNWQFNYTDASNNVTARPPIVWIRPYFTMMNAYGQIINTSVTQSGNDYYLKYIYVINGYWLQIDKNITSVSDSVYRIHTVVENIGNAATPDGLVVTIYDYVPIEFVPWNWTVDGSAQTYDSNQTVTGSGFNGTAYRWTVPLRGAQNASLYSSGQYSTYNVTYLVNGTGDYKVSELYIVGLDPRKVDGAGAHEGILVRGGFSSSSSEVFYVGIVLFLVIINVVNFVMTRRINEKLKK